MKKIFFLTIISAFAVAVHSQSNVLPSPPQKGVMYIKNATIHVGNGTVIENGTIQIRDGKIEKVGKDITVPAGMPLATTEGMPGTYRGCNLKIGHYNGIPRGTKTRDRSSKRGHEKLVTEVQSAGTKASE